MTGIAFIVSELRRRPVMLEQGSGEATPRVRQIAELVRDNPGITMSAIALRLGSAKRTAQLHLNTAMRLRLVRCDNAGKYTRWWPV